ncbi:hypothetical protein VIGAN_03200400 [Vigna angularis var. angularis]|uniref:Leucine-rich repeat-containing N-terminal plant-type domain-containing protein n=1 Tax=Vigna angularis var. angularis TaxID=157739 RepID=A0A0S3RN91_PHAAN|nr:hypothetical protein VIGAN_03200400 [Vigna angularis var. angularis]
MERALQWIVVVAVCASSTINRAAGIDETPHRKLANVDYSVDAIKRIKDIYKISRMKWQGDPCGPTGFTWDGLTCNARNPPRIISLP